MASMTELFTTKYPGVELYVFGHIGDGNLHVNALKPESMSKEDFLERAKRADQDLFALVTKHRGSVSAEHGIGLLKKQALPFSRTPAELALFRGIKHTLDPQGLLNPGKIFD
jgi:FAD/FMN-containing dehydrogenase